MKATINLVAISVITILSSAPVFAASLQLSLPLDCEAGKTCFIQSYVDVSLSRGTSDYACGTSTYKGHKGVDFRLLSAIIAHKGVIVRAAASGVIKAFRDNMADRLITNQDDRDDVRGRECGNGVVIDHGQGWETQYCHMKRGSVVVQKGQKVKSGAKLGLVGYSGMAQFAHVHLSLRYNGHTIDPFTGLRAPHECGKSTKTTLWTKKFLSQFPYKQGELIEMGFADRPVKYKNLESGRTRFQPPDAQSGALVFFARFINLLSGDIIRLQIKGPDGFTVQNRIKPLPRNKAHYMSFTGKRRRGGPWTSGRYRARVEIVRDGKVKIARSADIEIR